ncbi:MAG: NusG domain II-containing protein [Treponema succinifaciens]|nr:MAG: NusG domain II-containing protein [Treponema succinifaciens]
MNLRLKPFDIVFILIFLIVIFLSLFNLFRKKNEKTAELFLCRLQKEKNLFTALQKDGIYKFKGLLGESSIQVESGKAKFLDSPCENKNCIQSGEISVNGQWTACLPNGIFINIEGKNKENTFDAVSN